MEIELEITKKQKVEIALRGFDNFLRLETLAKLDRHFAIQSSFQSHQVSTACGCNIEEAEAFLVALKNAHALTERKIAYSKNGGSCLGIYEVIQFPLLVEDEDYQGEYEEDDVTVDAIYFKDKSDEFVFLRSLT